MKKVGKEQPKPKGKPGRPKKVAVPGTTVALGLLVPAELKTRLDAAAEAAGRSQGEEAARRLETSFELQPIKEIMTSIGSTGEGGRWFENPAKAALVFRLIDAYLRSFLSGRCKNIENFDETFGTDDRADAAIRSMFNNLAKREKDV